MSKPIPLCPRCGSPMPSPEWYGALFHQNRRSIDHILPQVRGGTNLLHGDVRNTVVICQACNSWRADCVHCWAMAACIEAVSDSTGEERRAVYRRWGLGSVRFLHEWRAPEVEEARRVRSAHMRVAREAAADRKAANAERVAIARALDRIGLDEFVWPAETAAARVWNLATLARRYVGPVSA